MQADLSVGLYTTLLRCEYVHAQNYRCCPMLLTCRDVSQIEGMGYRDDAVLLETLKSCVKSRDLAWGKHVHAYMVITKVKVPLFFLNIIMDMYSKCGSLEDARVVFGSIQNKDVVSWNVMISSYTRHGFFEIAIELFRLMGLMSFSPDNVTYLGLLDACTSLGDVQLGAQSHIQMTFSGLKLDTSTTNALINMYSKCRSMELATEVFNKMDNRDVASWNTILSGYSMHKDASKVLEVFKQMEQDSVKPDAVSYICVLNACALLEDMGLAQDVHTRIKQGGIKCNLVLENALLHMYVKCGSDETACKIFNQMSVRNVISWTVIIVLNSNLGDIDNTFFVFHQMHCEGVCANDVAFLSILGACSCSAELNRGKQIHTFIIGNDLEGIVHVENAIVDMYSKCGSLVDARKCFLRMRTRDMVTWNTIVSSYGKHGHGKEVLKLVQQMREDGFKLDSAMLASLLCACSRAGLVVEALSCLNFVEEGDGLVLNASHYACLVDMLARAGLLETADKFYEHIPDEPNLASWRTLLSACKMHGDPKRGKAIVKAMVTSQCSNAEILETISNMHFFLPGDKLSV